ncbi:MAG: prepilin-type N-terminal cleavage/methylation domain-containing protein [Gammaproteobacteria bacterium]
MRTGCERRVRECRVCEREKGKKHESGVTLVELMSVCVIVSIVLVLAVPGYRFHLIRSYRDAARAELGQLLLRIERFRVVTSNGVVAQPIAVNTLLTSSKARERYDFKLSPNPPLRTDAYRLIAVPKANSPQKGNGALSLLSDGVGCWYKGRDRPANFACQGAALPW